MGLLPKAWHRKTKQPITKPRFWRKWRKNRPNQNSRDDTGGLSLTNMETQYLLNRILTIYAGQLTLDTLNEVSGFDKSYYQDGNDEENGEEK